VPLFRTLRVPLGRIAGIRFGLHASWFLVFAFVVWATGSGFASIYPRMGGLERVAISVVTALVFFACLAAHELAHALVSRRFGIRVRAITLFLFGGVAEIEGEIDRPGAEFAVALVGPAVSLVLASLSGLVAVTAGDHGWRAVEALFGTLALVNLGVTLFNLVPGLPLDGGRLLRAGLWRLTGDRRRATRVAAGGGRVVAVALALLGCVLALTGDPAGLWYVPMGAFLWVLAGSSARTAPASGPALALRREGEAT
jgi:Zn-dependent protease